jgi:hypothetical protein
MSKRIQNDYPGVRLALVAGLALFTAVLTGCNDDDGSDTSSLSDAQAKCADFQGKAFGEATITSTTFVPATEEASEHCLVYGEMDKDLDFEVRMPTDCVNIPVSVAPLIRVFRPLVFRQVFPWRQVFQ